MSDAKIQRLNRSPSACLRLRSKECISDSAILERKAIHHAPGTSANHTTSTFGVSGERTCCAANDSESIFIKKAGPGGKAREQGTVTEDVLSPHPLPDEMKDKESDIGEPTSGMLVKNATTKGIYFHASPKKSRFYAIKVKKTVLDKKPGKSLGKGEVVSRIERPGWQVSSNGKVKCVKETFKDLKVNKSSFSSQSVSSKLSEPFRAIVRKSRSGVTLPHQSKKRIFVTSQVVNPKQSQEKVDTKLTIRQKTYFPFLSTSKVAKTQSSQNCYFISFNVTPRKVFCKSHDTVTKVPRLEDVVQCMGFPHKCVGYENLFNTDCKIKSDGSLNKRQAVSKQKSKGKTKGKVKSLDSVEISRYRVPSKRCVDKPREIGSNNEGRVEDASYRGKCHTVGSKLSVRSVPCEKHSIQNIFQNSGLVFFNADKQSKKTNTDGKTATARPTIKLFTRNMIEGKKQPSNFDHFIYRQKLPSFNYGSASRSKSSAFTHSSLQSTTIPKRSNSCRGGIPHSAMAKNRLLLGIATDEVCVSKKKHNGKKTGSLTHKAVKNKDKSKLAVTSADTKKASRDSSPSVHINILKRRPQTTICHYRNEAKGESYPDSCSSSDIESPNSEISKHIPEVTHSEMTVCPVQNAFGEETSWDCYGKKQESMSSFFGQRQPQRTIGHYRNKAKGESYPDSCSSSDIESHNNEISKHVREVTHSETAVCPVQNAFGENTSWDCYGNAFNCGSALRSKSSAFTQSSSQSTTVPKRSNHRNMIRNSIRREIPHSAMTKNRLLPGIATVGVCVSKKKHNGKKTRSLKHKAVKNKDQSKLAVTSADTKKASKDSPPSVHINILKRRPQRTICLYRNKAKGEGYPDSCSSSDIESPNNEISKHLPEVTHSETSVCTVQNAFGENTFWDCYGNTSNYGSALRSKSSAFTQSSSQSTTVPKRSNHRNMIRNSIRREIPHSAMTKNRLLPGIATVGACVSKKKHNGKNTRSLKHKAVKNKDKSKLAVTSADTKKASKDSPPIHINILKRRPQSTICLYRNKAKGERYPRSCFSSDIESCFSSDIVSPNNEISKHIPEVKHSETAVCPVQNAFDEESSWDCYGNKQESMSFFRQISSCDGSTRKDQMAMLCGTFRLPASFLSRKKHKFGLYDKKDLRNHAKLCIPKIARRPSIQQSQSSCCTLPLIPPLLEFLNSINTTLSVPIFTRTPENDLAIPGNNRQIQQITSTIKRLPIKNYGNHSGIEGSISQKGSKNFKSQTDVEQTCAGEELEKVSEKVLAGDKDAVDIPSELNKTRHVNDTGTDLTMCDISKRDGATQKLTTKNNSICSLVSSTSATESILHLRPISGMKETQQCVRNKSLKPPYKISTLQEKYHNRPREESRIRQWGPAPAVKERRNCKLIILFFCFLIIIQVMMYFRNQLYYLIP